MKWLVERSLRFRLAALAFAIYLVSLFLFTFFPRPILESGNPAEIAEFLQSHANFFYKILYADTNSVARGNFFMLTPFIVMAHLVWPRIALLKLFLAGVAVSALIELVQLVIPGRVSDPVDFISNTTSLVWGLLAIQIVGFIGKKRA